jgi:predicted transcriptional regulator
MANFPIMEVREMEEQIQELKAADREFEKKKEALAEAIKKAITPVLPGVDVVSVLLHGTELTVMGYLS